MEPTLFEPQLKQKLDTWLRSNKLAVNTGKTKIMIFYPKCKRVPDNVVFH